MMDKHFLHDPTYLVHTSLQSVPLLNPSVALDESNRIIYRLRRKDHGQPSPSLSQVALVSGGGSGHEPSFASYVGEGLLSAAVAGSIFASPGAEQVRHAVLKRVNVASGVLVIVMNYTVGVLNNLLDIQFGGMSLYHITAIADNSYTTTARAMFSTSEWPSKKPKLGVSTSRW